MNFLARFACTGILCIGFGFQLWGQCDASFTFTQSPNTCAATPVLFSANADPTTVQSYAWTFGDGGTANTANPSHQYPVVAGNQTYTVILTLTDTSGMSCNTSQSVTIQGITPIVASLSQPFRCTSDTTVTSHTLTISIDPGSMGLGPFDVDFGDSTILTNQAGPTISHTYTQYGTFDIRISGNGAGCPGFYQEFFFYTDPVAVPVPGAPFICEDQSITVQNLSDISKGNIDYFIWDWGAFGPNYTVFDTATQTYEFKLDSIDICSGLPFSGYSDGVTLTAVNKCSDHFTFTQIKIRARPRAFFDWPKPVCLPNAVVPFINNSCPIINYIDPATFTWIFENPLGGFDTLYSVNPIYTYTQAGNYSVTLIASNGCGADTLTKQVRVIPPPMADFVLDTTQGCINFCVGLDNLSTPTSQVMYQWDVFADTTCWDFADTTQSASSFEPDFCFACTDTFPIRLTVTNVCGVDSVRDSVFAWRPPDMSMAAISDTCGTFVLDSIAYAVQDYGSPISQYSWTFVGTNPSSFNGPTPPPLTFGTGNNSIMLCVTNDCGQNCLTRNFRVDPLPQVSAGGDTAICLNDTLCLNGSPLPGYWTGPSVDSIGCLIPDSAGLYQLIFTHQALSCRAYDTVLVTVQDTPMVTVATSFIQECFDSTLLIPLNAQPAGGTWSGPNLINGNQFRADTAGIFQFVYSVPDSLAGCVGRGFVTIQIDSLPEISNMPPFVLYCYGNFPEPLPSVLPPGGTWSGSCAIQGNTFNPNCLPGPDTLTIYYTVMNTSGCESIDSLEVRVVNPTLADAGPVDTLCHNHGIDTLKNAMPPGGSWSLLSGNYLLDSTGIFNALLMQSGDNFITYTVFKGTSCEASDQTSVFINDTLQVSIGPDTIICSSADAFLLASNQSGGIWSGMGILNPATGLYDPGIVPAGISDMVCYEVFHPNGCASRDCRVIEVDSLPTPGFAGPTVGCVMQTLTFPITSTYATTHLWKYCDTCALTSSNSYSYAAPNTYTITQYAYNANGCVDSISRTIDISEPPSASFTADVDSGCGPLTVNFTNTSNVAGGSCFWDFGNGDTSSLCNPGPQTYLDSSDVAHYVVTLTITNLCDTVSASKVITVFPRPKVIFNSPLNTGCSVLPVQFGNLSTGQPTGFSWYRNAITTDSLFSTDSIPALQYFAHSPDTGISIFTIYLVASNACGVDTGSKMVEVHPNTLDALFNTDMQQGCAPLTVTFTDLSGAPFTCWEINGTNPPGDTVSYTFQNPGTYLVKHCANDQCSFDTNEVVITVYPQPNVSFTADTQTVCQGDTVHFFNFSQNTSSQVWNFGDSNLSSAFSPSHVYQQDGTYTVTLTAYADTNACSNQASLVITVLPPPVVNFVPSDTAGCPPLDVSFSGVPPNLNYLWEFGDNNTSVLAQPTHTYSGSGYYLARLSVIDNLGCRNQFERGIRVHDTPVAAFQPDADTLCGPGIPVSFQPVAQGDSLLAYTWDFGDNSPISTMESPSHTYMDPGEYMVRLWVQNAFTCVDSSQHLVVILPIPQAQATVSDSVGCVPLGLSFSDFSTNSMGRRWLINGLEYTQPNPSLTFTQPDTCFTITLIADTAGFCLDTTSLQVCTASPPQANFSPLWTQFCAAPALNRFVDSSQASLPITYAWTFGDGGSSVLKNPEHIFGQIGTFPVKLVVSNSYGCKDSLTQVVEVLPKPIAQFTADPERGCSPLLVNFTDQSQMANGWRWDFGDGAPAAFLENPVHTFFATDTSFTVRLVVDTAGFCFDTVEVLIEVASAPIAAFTPSLTEACESATISFDNQSFSARQGLSYLWRFGNGDSSSLSDPSVRLDQPGSYPVVLIARNAFGCADTSTQTITIYPQAQALFALTSQATCTDDSIRLQDLSTQANQWRWDWGDGSISTGPNPVHVYDQVGTYSVELQVSYDGRCGDTLRIPNLISILQSPLAAFMTRDTSLVPPRPDGHVRFLNQSQLADRYLWNFGNGDTSTAPQPLYQYLINDSYEVSLVAYASSGCTDTAWQTISIGGIGGLEIPTALAPLTGTQPSPGDPGSGDLFTVFYPRGLGLSSYHVAVYTRWGDLIWESKALEDGVPTEWWDGRDPKGKLMSASVFIYQVHEAIFEDGKDWPGRRTGNVTLIR